MRSIEISMAKNDSYNKAASRQAWGIFLLVLFLLLSLSVFSYDWRDISLLKAPPNNPQSNLIGPVGAWLSFLLLMGLGVGAYIMPLWCLAFGAAMLISPGERAWPKAAWSALMTLSFTFVAELHSSFWAGRCYELNIVDTGGILGRLIMQGVLIRWLSPVGAGITAWAGLVASFTMLVGPRNFVRAYNGVSAFCIFVNGKINEAIEANQDRRQAIEREERKLERRRKRLEKTVKPARAVLKDEPHGEPGTAPAIPAPEQEDARAEPRKDKKKPRRGKPEERTQEPSVTTATAPIGGNATAEYQLPPIDLLAEPRASRDRGIKTDSGTTARVITETLAEFGIEAEVTNVEKGPVVTRYEVLPAPGVRVERISGLSNNLALSLKATSVRVQAPIPGKGAVGIEVPNSVANMVYLREILESDSWRNSGAHLPLVLGKDVAGSNLIADLADMPHMLIAGATGAGKTVCMNSILAGLLMSRTPDQMKLLLVDPKIVEFSVFNHLPHLVVPVITNPKKVAIGLRWAINEMESRYKLFARKGVRNIASYNSRVVAKQEDLFGGEEAIEKKKDPDRIPYIVVVIDELADLMLADQAEIENCVARLAQLSRAVGIHMIISTQRPSVNVITGTIKANFPARIAFQVAQKVDSRTILDTSGADKLLGKGDMLFLPPGTSKLVRAQGAMTSDEEIRKICDFIKAQSAPSYETEIHEKIERSESAADMGDEDDDLLGTAIDVIRETQRASTSMLQRRLRIGYTRAARIMDILESRGIVGPPRGSDPREILVDLDGGVPDNQESIEEEPD